MSLSEARVVARRRHGEVLENALLDAAWEELVGQGYDSFTIDAVAVRAHTSRAVLYRRWSSKQELVKAAIESRVQQTIDIPNTGHLRGDLIEFMNAANGSRAQKGLVLVTRLGAFYSDTGTSLSDLRKGLMQVRSDAIDQMLQRAIDRGEIDPDRLTPRIRRLPFDLFLQELMMTLKPVPKAHISEIVDDIFLPLVGLPGHEGQIESVTE